LTVRAINQFWQISTANIILRRSSGREIYIRCCRVRDIYNMLSEKRIYRLQRGFKSNQIY